MPSTPRIRPIRRYRTPAYPTQTFLLEHPELLRYVPRRWRNNRLALGLLGMVLPLLTARPVAAGDPKSAPKTVPQVAPLFIHGDGRGAFGCVSVNPPHFLSEDEARQVVQDEAQKAGIHFATNALTVNNAMVPVTDPYGFAGREEGRKGKRRERLQRQDLALDGYDPTRNLAYQVITLDDLARWAPKDQKIWSSVSTYDFKGAAEALTNGLSRGAAGKTLVAVFYDPVQKTPLPTAEERLKPGASTEERTTFWKKREEAGRAMNEQALRAQVQDFVQWLKAQGVI